MFSENHEFELIIEYFNPTPVTVNYRGNKDVLFKRDFAKELLSNYKLEIVKYGFVWSQDPTFPLDDINWFLFKKKVNFVQIPPELLEHYNAVVSS